MTPERNTESLWAKEDKKINLDDSSEGPKVNYIIFQGIF